ncbi:MAG: energy-coupling factor transporter transmembrane component T [Clostridium sp.]
MSNTMLSYIKKDSIVDRLTGATKLIFFISWCIATMITFDTRFLFGLFIISIVAFKVSKIEFKEVSFVVYFILFFLALNNLAIFIFAPFEGVSIYGTQTDLVHIAGPYTITLEQLFYQFNITLKYFTVIPMALLFIVTTNPSEFAASLNKIGVSYKIAYTVSIALRYIPDVQREYKDISLAQQARGIDMSKKEKVGKRIKNSAAIILPLIFSSLDRIETIVSAMVLRSFGEKKKRTWYNAREYEKRDFIVIILAVILVIVAFYMTNVNGGRFYNPFI